MIPAKYFWPGFIITLLSIAIGASFTILYFAQSDGGPQVIPDYYEKSVSYDELYDARQASIELGWEVDVRLTGAQGELMVRDRAGDPVSGAQGTLTFYRPSLADAVDSVELSERAGDPGLYDFEDAAKLRGYWDLKIKLERGEEAFIKMLRTSVPQS